MTHPAHGGASRRCGDVVDRGSSPILVRTVSARNAGQPIAHLDPADADAAADATAAAEPPGPELSGLRKQWLRINERFNRRMGPAGMARAAPPARTKRTHDHGWRTQRHPENAADGIDAHADAAVGVPGGDAAESPMRLRGYLAPGAGTVHGPSMHDSAGDDYNKGAGPAQRRAGAADVVRPPELEACLPVSAEHTLQAVVERFGWAFPLRTVVVEVQRHGPGHDIGLQVQGGVSSPVTAGDGNLYIAGITAMSPAAKTRQIGVGDRLVEVDGVSLVGADRAALHLALARSTSGTVTITVLRPNRKAVRAAAAPAGSFSAGLREGWRSDSPAIAEVPSAAEAGAEPLPDRAGRLSERAIGAMLRDMDSHLEAQAQVIDVQASIDIEADAFGGGATDVFGWSPADTNWKVTPLYRPPSPQPLPPPHPVAMTTSRQRVPVVAPVIAEAGHDDATDPDPDAAVPRLPDPMDALRPGSAQPRHAALCESLQRQLAMVEADIRAPSAAALHVQLVRARPAKLELQLAQTAMQFTALEEEMAGLSFSSDTDR